MFSCARNTQGLVHAHRPLMGSPREGLDNRRLSALQTGTSMYPFRAARPFRAIRVLALPPSHARFHPGGHDLSDRRTCGTNGKQVRAVATSRPLLRRCELRQPAAHETPSSLAVADVTLERAMGNGAS
jgi:hypothetical protein